MKTLELLTQTEAKKALVRADLDVPLNNTGSILNNYRLVKGLPTLKRLLDLNIKPIICGHIGKPQGNDSRLSTQHLKPFYDKNLGTKNYELLENLRFDPRETINDETFAQELASKADIYVNDSFATCHRKHASIIGVAKLIPAYAGCQLASEVKALTAILTKPLRPLVVIIGGAKLESKKPVVQKFIPLADHILLGGLIGLNWDTEIPQNVYIPIDYATDNLDIGRQTVEGFSHIIESAKTIVWAGPMGNYEQKDYTYGTKQIAQAIATSSAYSVVGGGDTIAALEKVGMLDKMNFVSTGGSAMLEYLVQGTLPGIGALN